MAAQRNLGSCWGRRCRSSLAQGCGLKEQSGETMETKDCKSDSGKSVLTSVLEELLEQLLEFVDLYETEQ